MKHKKIVTGVVVVGAGLLMAGGMLKGSPDKAVALAGNPQGKLVNVAKAGLEDIQAKITTTGILEAKESETVCADLSGKVASVKVEVGDVVNKGDVLVVYDRETRTGLERDLAQIDLQLETARIALNQIQNPTQTNVTNAEINVTTKENAISDMNDTMRQSETSLGVAQTDLANAQKQYDVTKALFDEGLESQMKLDDAEKALKMSQDQVTTLENKLVTLKSNLDISNKQLETARYDLEVLLNNIADQTKQDNMTIRQNDIKALELRREALVDQLNKAVIELVAPTSGTVAAVNVKDGNMVAAGTEMIKIIDPSQLIARAEIGTYYAAQLVEGLDVQVKFNGSTTIETTGSVSLVSPVALQKQGATSTVIPVEIAIDMTEGLKEGLLVDLKVITTNVSDVMAVPLLATLEDDEKESYLFVVDAAGVLEKRYVKEGVSDNQSVQVSDVEVGEIVVTNPTQALESGMTVSYKPFSEKIGDGK